MFKKTFLLAALFTFLFASETSFTSNEDLTLIGSKAVLESQLLDMPDSMWIKVDSITIGSPPQSYWRGLALDPNGVHVWVASGDGAPTIQKRLLSNGSLVSSFTGQGTGPYDMVRFEDTLAVANYATNTIYLYDTLGSFVRSFPFTPGSLRGLDWDGSKFWASSVTTNRPIYTVSRTGTLLRTLPGTPPPSWMGVITLDHAISNRIWITNGNSATNNIFYCSFDTTANTYTMLDTFNLPCSGYPGGMDFYGPVTEGSFIYCLGRSNTQIWKVKVHEPPPMPGFLVLPTSLAFGDVNVGSNKIDSVEVTNPGAATLNVTNVASDNTEFTINPTSGSVAPAASMWFYITFTPTSAGAKSGNIEFTHDAASSPDTVVVTGNGVAGGGGNWEAMTDIPSAPSGKNPKSGSCMDGLDATGLIYFLKASNQPDFYSYDPITNTWNVLETIPKGEKTEDYADGKYPKRGAAMATYEDGKCLYVVRGNNRLGFWKYQCDTLDTLIPNTWRKMATIPAGQKRCKYGTGLTKVEKGGNDYLFLMKGAKTSEFYLYDIEANTWNAVSSPPTGASGKAGYKKGSCLAYDGSEYVYILQGYYGSFFRYKVEADSWAEMKWYDYKTYLNREGKKKKPKDGAALVYYNNNVYMLKGGNTVEVWEYDNVANDWSQMPLEWDIPLGGGKKVKDGGSMINFDGFFWASKGKNTPEFYRHGLPTVAPAMVNNQSCNEGMMGKKFNLDDFTLTIAPNPTVNVATVRYSIPVAGPVTFKLYNVTGALVKSHTIANPTKEGVFLVNELPAGVYILRFNAGNIRITRKLVLEK